MLDNKDKAIIEYFQKNPRQSFTQAAKDLGMAKGTVQRRYDNLVERKLISEGIGLNLSQLKFSHALSFIEITNPQTEKAILDYFYDCPLVTAIFSLSGFEYNLVICLVADTREKIATFIDTFPLSHLPGVKRRNSFFVKESEGFSDTPFWFFFPNGSNKRIFNQHNCQNKCGVCGVMEQITEETKI
ncbi:MAG: Lrp/AsnC family transcriptional regulator [Candidatus Heimdallarchaeota archaeon]|nr:MAG: Lrp/AsnC family transcriptional regulator [Candidatus Heimdallarchaeota archaeon]